MKNLNDKILIAMLPLCLINIVQTDGEELSEGHLYPVEIEENQILEENLKRLLDQDKKKFGIIVFQVRVLQKKKV